MRTPGFFPVSSVISLRINKVDRDVPLAIMPTRYQAGTVRSTGALAKTR
jgi:hypothetical protein